MRRSELNMEKTQIFDSLFTRLEQGLPYYLYYHSADHTKRVIDRAVFLAKDEGLSDKEIELVKVAALYHDAGFLIGRKDHETKSCNLASKELPEFNFSKAEIKTICGMINATRIPQKTYNIYDKIVADADLFYLGTDDYDIYSNQLYKELQHIKPDIDEKQWFKIQLDFLYSHTFHTHYGRTVLDPVKQRNIKKLINSQLQK